MAMPRSLHRMVFRCLRELWLPADPSFDVKFMVWLKRCLVAGQYTDRDDDHLGHLRVRRILVRDGRATVATERAVYHSFRVA